MTRRNAPDEQLAFDIDALIHEADVRTAPAWEGAPLHFTTAYWTPEQLTAAFDRWTFEHGRFDSLRTSHMWHPAVTMEHANANTTGHDLRVFSVDLRCHHYRERCSCMGDLLYRAICHNCAWHHDGTESQIVAAWHDHAWPGWRELPIIPITIAKTDDQNRPTTKCLEWITEHYPTDWQTSGAPVITERVPHGTRSVPGRSPWSGFDLSHTLLNCNPN
ncbi:DUF6349 family protein [Gryllotalpicola reticulitermitis]|uniref:DUF6349 family protein n=1 Tax=Gryllotalpicola reticulitermitis TaxID=1184153 RepID=A0ABV8Q9L9_9MICO